MAKRRFTIVLIKPSHYDDDGYVIQWRRSTIPSNSLASVYGLLAECAEERVLGADVDIEIEVYDECNTIVDIPAISKRILADSGFVALVGVQSNQFPRALDIGRQFRKRGVTVAVGGFHVSGCIAMLPELPPDLKEAQALGHDPVCGRGRRPAWRTSCAISTSGQPKPVYNYLNDMPDMASAAIPVLPRPVVTRVAGHYTSFDAGRGCPFQCSFCTIINVQGRKSRYRTADDVEAIVRANAAQDVTRFFVTDDNFARNRNWEPILDRLIELRESRASRSGSCCRSTRSATAFRASSKRRRGPAATPSSSGSRTSIPQSLMGAKKRQNKIWEYRDMLQAWRRAKVMTWAGYILGFPTDTPESIARDIETIKRELPIDILEFFFLTPAAGLGGPQGPSSQGGAHGSGHEQLRSRACLRRPRDHVGGDVARRLSRRLGALLLRRACRDRASPGGGERHQSAQDRRRDDGLFRIVADRGRAPAAIRLCPAQDPDAAPAWSAGRQSACVLSLARVGLLVGRRKMGGARAALPHDPAPGARRQGRRGLRRRGAQPATEVDHEHDFVDRLSPTRFPTPTARRSGRPRKSLLSRVQAKRRLANLLSTRTRNSPMDDEASGEVTETVRATTGLYQRPL